MVALGASFRGRVWEGTSEENGTITKAPRGEEGGHSGRPHNRHVQHPRTHPVKD